jgi:hypothetical protein
MNRITSVVAWLTVILLVAPIAVAHGQSAASSEAATRRRSSSHWLALEKRALGWKSISDAATLQAVVIALGLDASRPEGDSGATRSFSAKERECPKDGSSTGECRVLEVLVTSLFDRPDGPSPVLVAEVHAFTSRPGQPLEPRPVSEEAMTSAERLRRDFESTPDARRPQPCARWREGPPPRCAN